MDSHKSGTRRRNKKKKTMSTQKGELTHAASAYLQSAGWTASVYLGTHAFACCCRRPARRAEASVSGLLGSTRGAPGPGVPADARHIPSMARLYGTLLLSRQGRSELAEHAQHRRHACQGRSQLQWHFSRVH